MSTKGAHRFVRHADETVVYVNSRRAGERVMAGTTQFVESKIKLRVNGDKSTVAGHGNRIFVGFGFFYRDGGEGTGGHQGAQARQAVRSEAGGPEMGTKGLAAPGCITTGRGPLQPAVSGYRPQPAHSGDPRAFGWVPCRAGRAPAADARRLIG